MALKALKDEVDDLYDYLFGSDDRATNRFFTGEQSKIFQPILNSNDFEKDPRPLDKGLWDCAVDTVGGKILANVLSQTKDGGIVAACGNASDIKLNTTVMPFIIRGVKLWGINSVSTSKKRREFVWKEASKLIDFEKLEQSIKTISLEELLDVYPKMLKGETSGRYIVDLNK